MVDRSDDSGENPYANLSPSQVRKIILDDHNVLRGFLGRLENEFQIIDSDPQSLDRLVKEFLNFQAKLLDHMCLEESILVPVLKEVDAWGPVRVERIAIEHAHQRKLLAELNLGSRKGPMPDFVKGLTDFVAAIRKDMEFEEQEPLSDETLKDDIITSGPLD